jgi:DNA ligase-4
MDIPFERYVTSFSATGTSSNINYTAFSVAALIYRLGHPPKARGSSETPSPTSPSRIFASWLNHLPKTRPPHSGKQLFRLLFPHEGSRRRYGLKETKLAAELERLLAVHGLARWDSVSWDRGGQGGTGCLGREVELIMRDRVSDHCSLREPT